MAARRYRKFFLTGVSEFLSSPAQMTKQFDPTTSLTGLREPLFGKSLWFSLSDGFPPGIQTEPLTAPMAEKLGSAGHRSTEIPAPLWPVPYPRSAGHTPFWLHLLYRPGKLPSSCEYRPVVAMKIRCLVEWIGRLCAIVATSLLIGSEAMGAEISRVGQNRSEVDIQFADPSMGCSFSLSGVISPGDAAKVVGAVEQQSGNTDRGFAPEIFCLDSPGGSLPEALEISKYFKTQGIGTKVLPDKTCESACALVFMAGSFHAHESGYYRWRILQPGGRLGFHAPSLAISGGNYSDEEVRKAYGIALASVSSTIDELIRSGDLEDGGSIRTSLLSEMLRTPSESMFYITTVDQAGQWEIEVGPLDENQPATDEQLAWACNNEFVWLKDRSSSVQNRYLDVGQMIREGWVKRENAQVGGSIIRIIVDEFTGDGCEFLPEDGGNTLKQLKTMRRIGGATVRVGAVAFYAPQTSLLDLPFQDGAPPSAGRIATSAPANMPSATGRCTVVQNARITDDEPCAKTSETRPHKGRPRTITSYSWPSGSKTIIVGYRARTTINGARTSIQTSVGGRGECATNQKTGSQFCYEPN